MGEGKQPSSPAAEPQRLPTLLPSPGAVGTKAFRVLRELSQEASEAPAKSPAAGSPVAPGGSPAAPARRSLRIGLVGFGNFGSFIASRFKQHGHELFVTALNGGADLAAEIGVTWVEWAGYEEAMLRTHRVDVLVISVAIVAFEVVLKAIPIELLRETRPLIIDVLSVKTFPKQVMKKVLPEECDLLCTHPMFGPKTAAGSWKDLRYMWEGLRITQQDRADSFTEIFRSEGCQMVGMSCEEHDRNAAASQFTTHLTGRMLAVLNPEPTPIDTEMYKMLWDTKDYVVKNSFDLFYGLFRFNPFSERELSRIKDSIDGVEEELARRTMEDAAAGKSGYFEAVAPQPAMPELKLEEATVELTAASLTRLRIGIVGFGEFGQFISERLAQHHTLFVTSLKPEPVLAEELGCIWVPWQGYAEALLLEHCVDVLVLTVPLTAFREVVGALPVAALRQAAPLVVDFGSVKVFPKQVMLSHLQKECDILCTHPIFGPITAKRSWEGRGFMFDVVRASRRRRAESFLATFVAAGCSMISMSCEEHDTLAAASSSITYITGHIMAEHGFEPTAIDTVGYKNLQRVKDRILKKPTEHFWGIWKYNPYTRAQLPRIRAALEEVERELRRRMTEDEAAGKPNPFPDDVEGLIDPEGEDKRGSPLQAEEE